MGSTFWELLKDPVVWAGLERIISELGAVFCIWAGYKFYRMGFEKTSRGGLGSYKSNFWTSGVGAGLSGLFLGALILIAGLVSGKEPAHLSEAKTTIPDSVLKQMNALEGSLVKVEHTCASLLNTIIKNRPSDNATRKASDLSLLKEELQKLAEKLKNPESGKTEKKSSSRHSRRRSYGAREDNSSEY